MENDEIISGELTCQKCYQVYPIVNTIPRFVPLSNYSNSFGMQWNIFKRTQVDAFSGIGHSKQRFLTETNWKLEDLKQGEWVLDAGCGNGRFLEIATRGQAEIVGVDLSHAVDAARDIMKDRKNLHLVQASILNLPFRTNVFDKCYCIGVIQHTPDPEGVIRELPRILKPGGQLALTIYEKRRFTMLYSKYWLRPLTKRMNPKALLFSIKCVAPILFPLTEILFRIPKLNKVFKFCIPFANYVHESKFTWRQRYEWAILDTFDMLAPAYDLPQTPEDVEQYLKEANIRKVVRLPTPGLNMIGVKVDQSIGQ
jgi:SAM-dependent methyltransferase